MMGQIFCGDSNEKLKEVKSESIDLIVTDPPYGYSFMGKDWDKAVPSVALWKECLRILKPGGFAFVMSAPRQDVLSQMIVRLGEAGFETGFTSIYWTYSSGFPKAMNIERNISKSIDNIKNFNVDNFMWNLKPAKFVEALFQKNRIEVGLPTNSNDFVVGHVAHDTTENKQNSPARTAEDKSQGHQALFEENTFIVVKDADISQKQFSIDVIVARSSLENHNLRSKEINVTVPENVLAEECESIMNKIKGEEASKIGLGKVRSLSEQDINAFYAELIESWKRIISSLSVTFLNSGMTSQTECVSATTVIITKSTMACLISSTADMLEKKLREENKKLDGSYGGFQPKPAVEIIIVCMKPLNEKTYVEQAMKNGKGITWLDDGRIPYKDENDILDFSGMKRAPNTIYGGGKGTNLNINPASPDGRFPANLLVSDDVLNDGTISISKPAESTDGFGVAKNTFGENTNGKYTVNNERGYDDSGSFSRYFDLDAWFEKRCPKEAKKTYPFLIVPKAAKSEKNENCDEIEPKFMDQSREVGSPEGTNPRNRGAESARANFHPTVKPLKLMSYLVTLGSRENDTVLDPFLGSGTTALACEMLARNWIGIELSSEYVKIAEARLSEWRKQRRLFDD